MKVAIDSLIAALLDSRLDLSGDAGGGVAVRCRDCDKAVLAYYSANGTPYVDPAVANVATIPALWATAVDHLASAHRAEARS
ncbi:hypothetical protein AB0F17_08375 [Nonomuraea sp. NPDC026600]|uniref:hypothetical protein n=1 Tax=Nonomuraea sp. NPDC026600 TaxID=3155363 RepID=UPI0033DAEF1A